MAIQSLKLGITYEQLLQILNTNFSEFQDQIGDVTAISTALSQHNTSADAHSTLFGATIKNVTYEKSTGVFSFTKGDGTKVTIDTALEKVVANFAYNSTTKALDLTLDDGTVQSVPMEAFINVYAGSDTSTITLSVNSQNTIQASIKNNSITNDMLAAALKTTISNKVDKVSGKGLSTNDYTTEEKDKLSGIAANANNYVLPTGGNALGGVKNGGNVSIGANGTMSVGTKLTFTATDGWTTGENGNFVLTLTSSTIPLAVYRFVSEGTYAQVMVGISKTDTTIKIIAGEKFAGYVQVI